MSNKADSIIVKNNEAERRYETHTKEGMAFVDYEFDGDRLALTHTEVPEEVEGQGIGHKLVQAVLDDARKRHLSVEPLCPFVASFIAERPEYSDLVAPGCEK